NLYGLHLGQINHQPLLTKGITGNVMAAATHRDQQVMAASEIDPMGDIVDGATADNGGRPAFDHGVPDLAGVFIGRLVGCQELTLQVGAKGFQFSSVYCCGASGESS